jgi:hypothetical protein
MAKTWVYEQLDAGVPLKGADVDREFPGLNRNGARLLRNVLREREQGQAQPRAEQEG